MPAAPGVTGAAAQPSVVLHQRLPDRAPGVAEIPPQLWLLIRGVDPERWRETFNVSPAPTYAR